MNTTLMFTWTAYVAARGNPHHAGASLMAKRFATSPPLYAIAAGLLVSAFGSMFPLRSAIRLRSSGRRPES